MENLQCPPSGMNSGSQIITVVSLKRFMPDTVPKPPRLKRPYYSNLKPESSQNKIQTNNKTITKKDSIVEDKSVTPLENTSYNYSNEPQASKNKVKYRHCSHSPEELAVLHEHTDKTLVKLGDTFESRDSLRQHLNNNARMWKYYYVCRNSKEKVVEYNCICMAYNNKQRDVVIRKQKKRTTACPCKLRLTVDPATKKLVVYYVCNHHDHPTTAAAFSQYPHAKYLPQHIKEEFLDLTYLGLNVTLIQKYIFSVIGLKIKKKDIWSYAYRFKKKIFQRDLSETRREYIVDLIKRIQETFGELCDCDSTDLIGKPNTNTVVRSSAHNNDLNGNPSQDGVHKSLDDRLDTHAGVIVQYINEEGYLCDQNGILATNNTDIILINNYTYVMPDNVEDNIESNESVDNINEQYSFGWDSIRSKSLNNNITIHADTQALNDKIYVKLTGTECSEQSIEIEDSDCAYENRLSPTPGTRAVYAEMDNFNKYYYVDHQYITYEDRERNTIRHDRKAQQRALDLTSGVIRAEYIKAPNYIHSSPSLRYCSGHDHLESLTDPDAISAGAKFLTLEAFLKYVNDRANRWFFYYSLTESGKNPENYSYKCVYGKHRVSKNAYRAKGLRKRSNLKTDCPCLIRLRRLESAPEYLTVLYSCNHHDHPRDERQFNSQVHSRRLPPHMKEEIKDLVTLRVSADVLRQYLLDETGLLITGKYFYNLWAGMKRRNEKRRFTDERAAFLSEKVKDLGVRYGNLQNKNRKTPSQDEMQDCSTNADVDETGTPFEEYYKLTDIAEEVCIVQSDAENTKQSRLETRLENLSRNDIQMSAQKLQSVRSETQRNRGVIFDKVTSLLNLNM